MTNYKHYYFRILYFLKNYYSKKNYEYFSIFQIKKELNHPVYRYFACFFIHKNCKGNSIKEDKISDKNLISKKIEGLVIKNIDIDASGTYVVSGKYSSSSTGGKLLQSMEVETTEKPNETIVQLFPVFKSIGKDPVGSRVFSFQGNMSVETYFSKKLTVKISDTAKSLKRIE